MSLVLYLILCYVCVFFFFFKQKTAYEMRISDWSSDVCSSDLADQRARAGVAGDLLHLGEEAPREEHRVAALALPGRHADGAAFQRVEGGDEAVDRKSVV